MNNKDDKVLIEQCLHGDVDVFGLLVEKYQKPIFNVAYRMCNNYDDAKDIAQAAFVKAYEKLSDFNPSFKFFSWLYRIAVNEAVNFLKQKDRFENLNEELATGNELLQQNFPEFEMDKIIQSALMKLSDEYRSVIVLKHFQQLSYREIAETLNLQVKTVKSRLYSARQIMAEILTKHGVIENG